MSFNEEEDKDTRIAGWIIRNLSSAEEGERMVPGEGVEPSQYHYRRILSPVRLPISPSRQRPYCSIENPLITNGPLLYSQYFD